MITPKLKKKYEKLILELRYLTADYDYHRMAFKDAQARFAESFEEYRKEHNLLIPESPPEDSEDEFTELEAVEDEQQRKRINAVAHAVFKKIAKATHPDKLIHMTKEEQERRKGMFSDAQDASQKREWYRLLCIATDLGISLPTPTKEHIVLLESKNKELRLTIENINKTYPMVYIKMPNSASKENVFREFAKAVGYVASD